MQGLLIAQDLKKSFGGLHAVDGVNLRVGADEIISIMGPNGAGKTTLLNLLSGVSRPSGGSIRFDGRDVTGLAPHRFAELGIARTFQNLALFKGGTVLDNIRVGFHSRVRAGFIGAALHLPKVRREEKVLCQQAEELASFLGIAHVLHAPVGTLPYGQQKRVELARALASRPRLLLLDELVSGMNLQEKQNIADCIFEIRARFDCGIVMIEHDLGFVMDISDRIYVLNFGNQIADGLPAEIASTPEVITAYIGTAAGAAGMIGHIDGGRPGMAGGPP
jgi:branched-chain amino acid transport system ATP-binding protein